MALEGMLLNRYRLTHRIGYGGIGDVYLAQDTHSNRDVAVKVIRTEIPLHPDLNAQREADRIFQQELRAISNLNHAHILSLLDYGEQPVNDINFIYLVTPFCPDGSLADWLGKRSGSDLPPQQDIAHFMHQAADALQYVHDQQIVHGNIKPSNFLMRTSRDNAGRPDLLLTDFAFTKFTTAISDTSRAIGGTPAYMAPEQWQGHAVPATDQYALAVTLYELLTGHLPFQGNLNQILLQLLTTQPPLPSTLNPRIPVDIDEVILRALSKKPEDRFPSIAAFADAFQEALHLSGNLRTTVAIINVSISFDVFLCHNGEDKPRVKEIARRLKERGISPWLDEWELRPGLPWQPLLEEQIEKIKSAAVFIGKAGIGPWQRQEMYAFLSEFVNRGSPVIPVILEDAPQRPQLPIFLRGMTWVDFRKSDPDPLERLIWGIEGKHGPIQ